MSKAKVRLVRLSSLECSEGHDGYPELSIQIMTEAGTEDIRVTLEDEQDVNALEEAASNARDVMDAVQEREEEEEDEE